MADPVVPPEASQSVRVLSPTGEKATVDSSDLANALKPVAQGGLGFTLPGYIPKAEDLTDDGRLKVWTPEGEKATVAPNEFDGLKTTGFRLASQGAGPSPEELTHQANVEHNYQELQKYSSKELADRFGKAGAEGQVQDDKGNFQLVTPNGEKFGVPLAQLDHVLSTPGVKFQDNNFQALYEAHLRDKQGGAEAQGTAGGRGFLDKFFVGLPDWIVSSGTADPSQNLLTKADDIAERQAEAGSLKTARNVGEAAGTVAPLLIPGGAFGEVAAAGKAGAAVKASLTGAEVSPLVAKGRDPATV